MVYLETPANPSNALIDIPAVAGRALNDLAGGGGAKGPSFDLKDAALSLLSGGKVLTVFNDPDKPLRLGAAATKIEDPGYVLSWAGKRDGKGAASA